MSKKNIIILAVALALVGILFFVFTKPKDTSDQPDQSTTAGEVDNGINDGLEKDPNPLVDNPVIDPDVETKHTQVYGNDYDESLDVIPKEDRPSAEPSDVAKAFAVAWLSYDSSASFDSRFAQLDPYTDQASSLASVDPISQYLCDTRDNSGWVITSTTTGAPVVDDKRSRVYEDTTYFTVNVPVEVVRVDKSTDRVMRGTETFKLDLDMDNKTHSVFKIGGPNDWQCTN